MRFAKVSAAGFPGFQFERQTQTTRGSQCAYEDFLEAAEHSHVGWESILGSHLSLTSLSAPPGLKSCLPCHHRWIGQAAAAGCLEWGPRTSQLAKTLPTVSVWSMAVVDMVQGSVQSRWSDRSVGRGHDGQLAS